MICRVLVGEMSVLGPGGFAEVFHLNHRKGSFSKIANFQHHSGQGISRRFKRRMDLIML